MTIYKWPYKNDQIRKWLTISLGWECSNSRNPPPVGGAGLAGGCIGYCWPWGWAWSACDEEMEASCDIRGRAWGPLGRVWCGVSECQAEGLLLEIAPVVSWHSACEFKHPLEEADPLLMKSHVLDFVSVPEGRVQNLSLCPRSRSTWRLFHLSHYLLFHLFFSYIFWSAWERGEQEFW